MSPESDRRFVLSALAVMPLALSAGRARASSPRGDVVAKLAETIRREYQDESAGERLAKAILGKQSAGDYAAMETDEALAQRLTGDLRAAVNDQHLAVVFGVTGNAVDPGSDPVFQRKINYGIQGVRRLPGNIGLLELNFFPSMNFGNVLKSRYAAAMTLVSGTRALVVDIRDHIGGEPETVAFFVSYFFDRAPFLVNEIVYRRKPVGRFFTTDAPGGPRYGERRPVFVVTSSSTFSGGEEFAYDLQCLGRARIVGETTGGGANPNQAFDLGSGFLAYVPNGRAVNPITKSNWEGVGVKPDVSASAGKALEVAHRLALDAALAQATDAGEKKSIQQALHDLPASP